MIRIWYDTQLDNNTCDPNLGFGDTAGQCSIQYAFGLELPNYPVPAIRLDVAYGVADIWIVEVERLHVVASFTDKSRSHMRGANKLRFV